MVCVIVVSMLSTLDNYSSRVYINLCNEQRHDDGKNLVLN